MDEIEVVRRSLDQPVARALDGNLDALAALERIEAQLSALDKSDSEWRDKAWEVMAQLSAVREAIDKAFRAAAVAGLSPEDIDKALGTFPAFSALQMDRAALDGEG